ncbi:phosphoribosylanthranilate isomerase [Lacticaseibacillus hulanensis]|uniref:phosphoribosylanthranilate isomerase n=1 Tax=Lacticaseibacillus hulanensis TaxID=2493111 RepID=UPI000FDB0292|nr:phosphoribosylanthranilate isomerase [Lacticaseibacillus hulanensis]
MTKVKICGLMTAADVAIVNAAHPDYAGFVFAPGRHHVTLTKAQELRASLAPDIISVGVFVDTPLDEMLAAVSSKAISVVQLHGSEPEPIVQLLQERGAKVIRVFKGNRTALPQTSADFVMVDAGAGSGQTLNWQQVPSAAKPLFLAGGLTPANVGAAIATVHPFAVDVSSGVEGKHGKDPDLVAAFINNARAAS